MAGVAAAAPPADVDQYVGDVMQRFGVPGLSLAIVEGDKTVHAKGYGVRELGKAAAADEHTIFPIGSETKAVTAAALAILVDQGKLKWSDPVVKHMPDFRMYDPYVTEHMTVRDLLTHRSGLGLGQGDLLIIPSTDRARTDIVHALRHLKPKTGFREVYAYDNILYIVAGQLVQAVSGRTWEDFVRDNIFKPAGMSDASASDDVNARANHVGLHARTDGPIRGMGNIRVLEKGLELRTSAPAGAINASAVDMGRWMSLLIGGGKAPGGSRVFSEEALSEMWNPVVVVPGGGLPVAEIKPIVDTYALGWFVRDYRGHKIVTHSGGVLGGVAIMAIIPEKNVGISVAINSEDSIARLSVFCRLLDHYLELPPLDWHGQADHRRHDAGGFTTRRFQLRLSRLGVRAGRLRRFGFFSFEAGGYHSIPACERRAVDRLFAVAGADARIDPLIARSPPLAVRSPAGTVKCGAWRSVRTTKRARCLAA